ncbi:hypothetical protein HOLleu_42633 [Holothuria leucospilota]|uniref:Uncharacterized protein n=1 Tax=Holothuria leucospilota TaxID=206669 RepID=A0A9Q0YF89_HOLLE|nr:hypothetical protein HOLleu_42633 [Holothuria leucospilota]
MAAIGYGQTWNQLKLKVKAILDADGRPNPFKDNMPGHDWFTRFLSCHPHISERMGEVLGKERALVTVEKLKGWFSGRKAYVETIDADLVKGFSVLTKVGFLFVLGVSGFWLLVKLQ